MKTYFSNLRGSIFACSVSALLLFFGGGCATEVGQHTFLKQPYPAKPKDHPIDVYIQVLPTKPFERVAVLDAHGESQSEERRVGKECRCGGWRCDEKERENADGMRATVNGGPSEE